MKIARNRRYPLEWVIVTEDLTNKVIAWATRGS
jgi:hypothetical protein